MTTVEIDRDDLDILLWFAKAGDVAKSQRTWRTGFRKHAVCSGAEREELCANCRAFTAAEHGLKSRVV